MSYRQGTQFPGNMDSLAHTHPVRVAGRYPNEVGFPIGRDQNGIPRLVDHVMMRLFGTITTPLIMMIGDFGSGKTTQAMRVMKQAWMTSVRGGHRARIAADTTKRSLDVGEWAQFANELNEKSIDLAADFKNGINILDPKLPLKPSDHLHNIMELMSDDGTMLDHKEKHILRVSLEEVLSREERHITDANDVFATLDTDQHTMLVNKMGLSRNEVPPRISSEELVAICNSLYFRLSNIINGDFGQVLGGYQSLADVMSRSVVSFDYTSLESETMAPVQSFINRVRTAGVRYNDPNFFIDAEAIDESYERWDSMPFALSMRGRTKKLRGTGSLMIIVSQHISDYLAISGPQGDIARNMLRDVGGWVIFQHDVEDLPIIQEYCGLKEELLKPVPYLKPGQALYKFGSQPPFVASYELTEMMAKVSDTDVAAKYNLMRNVS